ncbi:hypothetical protein EYF80_053503 [Liparis tanakae]|uniref:Uncharacterized protein n=1 Tax=Liparis tanakae TaxID=230148 RepID=A0A4Z2F5F1_9TELE|nr:hypothetical protein EYF80_053503 [Liparis tanakae]
MEFGDFVSTDIRTTRNTRPHDSACKPPSAIEHKITPKSPLYRKRQYFAKRHTRFTAKPEVEPMTSCTESSSRSDYPADSEAHAMLRSMTLDPNRPGNDRCPTSMCVFFFAYHL